MASISTSTSTPVPGPIAAKGICQIVGLVCLSGFVIDMLILALPPSLGSAEWRLGVVQQFADRSIILLFGAALIIFGNIANRSALRLFSRLCLAGGIVFTLLCVLAIADSLKLQQQAFTTIDQRESQLQLQIREAQDNPAAIAENLTSEDLKQASQLLTDQANTLKQSAKTSAIKTAAVSVGNLLVVGLGLIGLGRYGLFLRTR